MKYGDKTFLNEVSAIFFHFLTRIQCQHPPPIVSVSCFIILYFSLTLNLLLFFFVFPLPSRKGTSELFIAH